jgi:hypothetical protein
MRSSFATKIMFRHIIALFFYASLACCEKTSPSVGIIEQSFEITKGKEDGMNAIRSLALEAKALEDSKEGSKEHGWKAVRARGGPIPTAASFKNRNEELEFYGSAIFQSLGYPLQETPGSGFSLKTNQAVVIRHRKEALTKFNELLERWRRSPGERFNDMLNGRE